MNFKAITIFIIVIITFVLYLVYDIVVLAEQYQKSKQIKTTVIP